MKSEVVLNKYRVVLAGGRTGVYVAAPSAFAAAKACFPNVEMEVHSDIRDLVRLRCSADLPKLWPIESKGEGGGSLLDVERLGEIKVVLRDS